jgi:hypothetical protein
MMARMKEENMFKAAKLQMLCLVAVIGLLAAPLLPAGEQKDPAPVPAAPVPAQILTAKRVFISNLGAEFDFKNEFTGGPNRYYNQFYTAMKDWGRYELVATPAEGDLIFEIHLTHLDAETAAAYWPVFKLVIVDPKSHVVLWAFTEYLPLALRKGHRDENFDKAMNKVVEDIKQLVDQGHSQ